jgi:hypothetical protein
MVWKLVFEVFVTFALSQALSQCIACYSEVFRDAHSGYIEEFATLSIDTFGVDGVDNFAGTTNL